MSTVLATLVGRGSTTITFREPSKEFLETISKRWKFAPYITIYDRTKGAPMHTLKVSAKGGVSVYGLGRFPITLYKEQWTKLLEQADAIREFIKENDEKLKTKVVADE